MLSLIRNLLGQKLSHDKSLPPLKCCPDMQRVAVLDHGYVELVDVMGSDLSVANAARASYAKRSTRLDEKDERLISFLSRNGHTSPFRHAMATFEIKAPLMVARQWWKYIVGSDHAMEGWNEASRRYITMEPEFYIPEPGRWRSTPENSKQGSGEPVNTEVGKAFTSLLSDVVDEGLNAYNHAMAAGIAAEQARVFLPAYCMYTNWWWTCSLQSLMHFLNQRVADDAQWEIQEYAKAVLQLAEPHFPIAVGSLGLEVS